MTAHPSPSVPDAGAAPRRLTAFMGDRRVAQGAEPDVVRVAQALAAAGGNAPALLVFDDATGAQVDLDLRAGAADSAPAPRPRGAGRPKLGVVAREVTLLPRHWEWLALQPGGASVALRKLVDEARRAQAARGSVRAAQERAYRFLQALAGNLPGYEEALRALYRSDAEAFNEATAPWPADVREHARWLSGDAFTAKEAT